MVLIRLWFCIGSDSGLVFRFLFGVRLNYCCGVGCVFLCWVFGCGLVLLVVDLGCGLGFGVRFLFGVRFDVGCGFGRGVGALVFGFGVD